MDHAYPFDPVPDAGQSEAQAALAERMQAFVAAGGRAVVLVGPGGAGKSAVLDTVLAGLPGRQIRLRNPTASALTLKRMLAEMGVAPAERCTGAFFRALSECAYDDVSAVMAVDDAHSLSPFALGALARVPGLGGPDLPGMVLLLVGQASLLGKLSAPGLELLRNSRRTLVLMLPEAGAARRPMPEAASRLVWTAPSPEAPGTPLLPPRPPALSPPVLNAVPPPPEPSLPRPRGPAAWQAALTGATLATIAVTAALWPTPAAPPAPPALVAAAPLPNSAPIALPALMPVAIAAAHPSPLGEAVPPVPEPYSPTAAPPVAAAAAEALLRREFKLFLLKAGPDTAKLSGPAREALFREYLVWRVHGAAAP